MKKKILIVDDDPYMCRILRAHFELLGYDSFLAVNGKEAVEMATSQLPILIVMDIMLPVMDGLQATRLIRKNRKTKSIPILAITARATLKDQEDCIQSGCNDFIAKPYTSKQLTASIEKLLGQNSNPTTFPPKLSSLLSGLSSSNA